MAYKINTDALNLSMVDLRQRIMEQCERMPDSLFAFNRNGLRLAIAAISDETTELYDEWRIHKRMLSNAHKEVRHELLDIAAIAMIAYAETIEDTNG